MGDRRALCVLLASLTGAATAMVCVGVFLWGVAYW